MRCFRQLTCFLAMACLIALFGCNRGPQLPSDVPKLIPCKITVTQEGAPLAGATVILDVAGGGSWRTAGTTDSAGVVVPMTNGQFEGVPEGKYKVVVTKTEQDASSIPPAPEAGAPGYDEWMQKYAMTEGPARYSLIEKPFTAAKTTTLELEVSGKSVEKTIDVGKKVREKM